MRHNIETHIHFFRKQSVKDKGRSCLDCGKFEEDICEKCIDCLAYYTDKHTCPSFMKFLVKESGDK